jgi:hypothetical protein
LLEKTKATGKTQGQQKSVFITGTNQASNEEQILVSEEDVKLHHSWKAHSDAINWVHWAEELKVACSCSFDCKVFLWHRDDQEKIAGSLLLGNRHAPEGQEHLPEFKRYRNMWKIKVDKRSRYVRELNEASDLWEECKEMDLEAMKEKGAKALKAQQEEEEDD